MPSEQPMVVMTSNRNGLDTVCVCVLQVLGCSQQTRSFSKNTRAVGYPSNQDTREVKAKVESKVDSQLDRKLKRKLKRGERLKLKA